MPLTADNLVGRSCSFQYGGKTLVGVITEAKPAEPFGKGKIPDFTVTVRGKSGQTVTVSFVETYMSLSER